MKPESRIVNSIIEHVKQRGGMAVHISGSMKQFRGLMDILGGFPDGSPPFWVEVKVPGEDPTPLQAAQIKLWGTLGFTTGCVHSVQEFDELIGGTS